MKKTIKNCLRKLCCNFCFMLIGAFSKAQMPVDVTNNLGTLRQSINKTKYNLIVVKQNEQIASNKEIINIYTNRIEKAPFPKKRKKISKQTDFEIKELPKGEYTAQTENESNIIVTKRTFKIK